MFQLFMFISVIILYIIQQTTHLKVVLLRPGPVSGNHTLPLETIFHPAYKVSPPRPRVQTNEAQTGRVRVLERVSFNCPWPRQVNQVRVKPKITDEGSADL